MEHAILIMMILVVVALIFDFMNGFHDAANSIALMVSTRLLTPQAAVLWAAFFNFIAFLVFGTAVAKMVGKGIVDPEIVNNAVIFGALTGAIVWNLITWWLGIPSSSSHALVGGLVGAAVAKGGTGAIVAAGLIKTSIAIILSPLFGMMLAIQPVIAASCVGVFLSVLFLTRYVSLSSILAGLSLPICVLWIWNDDVVIYRIFAVLVAVLIILTHQKNIVKILRGNESRVPIFKSRDRRRARRK